MVEFQILNTFTTRKQIPASGAVTGESRNAE
jgi:hypothetical protein